MLFAESLSLNSLLQLPSMRYCIRRNGQLCDTPFLSTGSSLEHASELSPSSLPKRASQRDFAGRSVDDSHVEEELRRSGLKENRWKNYYTRLCSGAGDAAQRFFPIWQESREKVFLFRRALHESTIPEASLQGAAANLSVLISPTCLRVEDGTLWGWEGVGPERGSCPGTYCYFVNVFADNGLFVYLIDI